jgi:MFS family permease
MRRGRSLASLALALGAVVSALAPSSSAGVAVALPSWPVFAASWFAWGLAFGPEHVTCDVYLVQTTPNRLRGRMYSGVNVLTSLGSVAGYASAGPLIGMASARGLIAVAGAGYLLAAPAFFLWRRERVSSTRDGAQESPCAF